MNDVDKAERSQALKAFLIPSGLFVACLFNAAGIYIMYSGNAIGVIFLGIGFSVILAGLFAFITFQNKHRAKGHPQQNNEPEPYMPPTSQRRIRRVTLPLPQSTDSPVDTDQAYRDHPLLTQGER